MYNIHYSHTRRVLSDEKRGLIVRTDQGYAGPTNIRGVDQDLWRWLKAQAALEGKTIGRKLNEILARYKYDAESL